MRLDPENDVQIEVTNLSEEFSKLPLLIYRYSELKNEAMHDMDIAETKYKELRAEIFKEILSQHDKKPSDKVIEAELDSNRNVKAAKRKYLEAKRDLETIKGYMEALRFKKDMIIQLGSDRRKEV